METLLLSAVTFGATTALFVFAFRLVMLEKQHGERLYLNGVRNHADRALDYGGSILGKLQSFSRSRLTHASSKTGTADNAVMTALLRHATQTPLTVVHNDSHLSKMYEHKTETALTAAQKRKLNKQKLEERF